MLVKRKSIMKIKAIRLKKNTTLFLLSIVIFIVTIVFLLVFFTKQKDNDGQNVDKIAKLSDEGALAAEANNYELAITKAKEKFDFLKNKNQQADTATQIASYYYAKGNRAEGTVWMDKAIAIYQSQNNRAKAESATNLKKKMLINDAGGVID